MQVLFINESYNETAAAKDPWHGDSVVSSKNDAVEESGAGKYAKSIIAACTCTHTSDIRIKMASARFYYTGWMSMMSLYHYGIKDIGWYVSFSALVIIKIQVSF